MDTSIQRRVRAAPEVIFKLAAAVEEWPRILPHYRWVRVLSSHGPTQRTVEMAARRDIVGRLGIPLRWTAVEITYPTQWRIEFQHVKGVTRGMWVAWTIEPSPAEDSVVLVRIRHVFKPAWPVPDAIVRAIVGEYFVNAVARRTLRHIGELAQRTA